MYNQYSIRTDLALESKERFESDHIEISGVEVDEYTIDDDIKITKVRITDNHSARVMKKPIGTYITIEASNMSDADESYHPEISQELAKLLNPMIPSTNGECSLLVVGLGNESITPDSLGPLAIQNLLITRHLAKETDVSNENNSQKSLVISALNPGVMAQTGMETYEILKGIIGETRPDCIIAIDALAARNAKRLNKTIQIADSGIYPGSGVGNHRKGLTQDSLGVKVIGIGVPTVIDAATIVYDSMQNILEKDQYGLLDELIPPSLYGMFVTPKNIDDTVKRLSFTISEGINQLYHNRTE